MDSGTPFQRIRVKALLTSNWESYSNIEFVDTEDIASSDVRVELQTRGKRNESVVGVPQKVRTDWLPFCLASRPAKASDTINVMIKAAFYTS